MHSHIIRNATTSKLRNVCVMFCCFGVLAAGLQLSSGANIDAREIMKRSLEAGDRNAVRLHEYISSKRVDEKQLDTDGSVRSETVKFYDHVMIDKLLIRKLVAKDGKPLPLPEARKEDDRVKRIVALREHEKPSDKANRLAEEEKKRVKQLAFSREILDAFQFRLAGVEQVDGRKCWLIEAAPALGYKPKEMRAQVFPHLKGMVWVDQQDYLWTKAEADAADPISVGFGIIAKLEQGAHLYFDQTRLPDGVWLLRDSGIHAVAHVAIVKRIGIEQVSTFDNFRKVPSGVEVVEDSTGN